MALEFHRGLLSGGGWVTDIDISADGTLRLIRTDVHQCYKFNSSTGLWQGLLTPNSLPAGEGKLGNNGYSYNCYALRLAPSNPDIIYGVFPATTNLATLTTVYKSTDRGDTWVQTGLSKMNMTVNAPGRMRGQKMAVHPTDPDIVIVGNTAGEFYRTTDGGDNWSLITTPTGADPSVVFDPTDGDLVYIGWGSGTNRVYRSTDAGATFAQMTGGPNTINRSTAAIDGTIYIVSNDGVSQNAYKLSGTTFTNLSPTFSGGFWAVACDPTDVNRVTLMTPGGEPNTSLNAGSTWSGMYGAAAIRVANDVPWLAWTSEGYMSNGNIAYDPVVPGRLWVVEGIGIWYTDSVPTGATQPTWTSQTAGNDELIIDAAIWPPGGKLHISTQDRGVFRISDYDNYPSTHLPGPGTVVNALQHAYGIDYASSDPDFICACCTGVVGWFYSTDGGLTASAFADQTPRTGGKIGGSIAALTPLNIVGCANNNAFAYYTTDGGDNWSLCTFPGDVPTTGSSGFGFLATVNGKAFAADRVDSTFYAYNTITGDFYKSVDGGANFTKTADAVSLGFVGNTYGIYTVPGHAGHIFYIGGTVDPRDPHPYNISMKRSTNAGSSWSSVTNTQEVWAIGFGKEAPGGTYPTIMIAGYANGDTVPGIYTSEDNCATWVLQANNPVDTIDLPRAIAGDLDNYGYWGIGLSATGFLFTTPEAPTSITGKCFGLQF